MSFSLYVKNLMKAGCCVVNQIKPHVALKIKKRYNVDMMGFFSASVSHNDIFCVYFNYITTAFYYYYFSKNVTHMTLSPLTNTDYQK
jgi:hypothetical protein